MLPKTIKFTELELNPQDLLLKYCRKITGPIPSHWSRHQFFVKRDFLSKTSLELLDEWIYNNLYGKWASNIIMKTGGDLLIVAFEDDNDMVMFRLSDGETIWNVNI